MKRTKADLARELAACRREPQERRAAGALLVSIGHLVTHTTDGALTADRMRFDLARRQWDAIDRCDEERER